MKKLNRVVIVAQKYFFILFCSSADDDDRQKYRVFNSNFSRILLSYE